MTELFFFALAFVLGILCGRDIWRPKKGSGSLTVYGPDHEAPEGCTCTWYLPGSVIVSGYSRTLAEGWTRRHDPKCGIHR